MRMRGAELSDRRRQQMSKHRGGGIADDQFSNRPERCAADLGPGDFHCSQYPACALQEMLSGLGERYVPFITIEETSTELFLQCPNLCAQRRLRNVQAFGGTREVQFLRNSDKVADPPQFHDTTSIYKRASIWYWRI